MISRQHRFHGHNSLNFVYRNGRAARDEYISLRYAPSSRTDYRLAVVVSKKVSKSAVVRNRIRRRVFEIVRVYRKELGAEWPVDLVIGVFDERLAKMPPLKLKNRVYELVKKAGCK